MQESVFELLSPKVRSLAESLGLSEPTLPQTRALPRILNGENLLIVAPTGSGKTEAALLGILDKMAKEEKRRGISLLYITPLRALNRDMLSRLTLWCQQLGLGVDVRHGDTPLKERRRQSTKPPDILVTTPETLQAILPGSRMRSHLNNLRWVIIDEVHNLAESRRGAQLSIALERVEKIGCKFQRIGLSATVGNLEEVGSLIAGKGRCIGVIDVSQNKRTTFATEMPKPCDDDYSLANTLYTAPEVVARLNRVVDLANTHTSTLLFVNSRTHAESLSLRLGMLKAKVGVHHGSLPREERAKVENEFRSGSLPLLVCTSTLELGIDIGSADLAIQYMSPRQVSALVQRVGRSGHSLSKTSEGVILTVSPDDVLESQAVVELAQEKAFEPAAIHYNALDVLAHQVVGLTLDFSNGVSFSELFAIVAKAGAYSSLPEESLRSVVDYLIKLRFTRTQDSKILRTAKGREYYYQNLSMIPDERRYKVVDVTTHEAVGILGEEFMMLHAKKGVNFIVKGRVWRIESITEDAIVYVSPVEDPTAAVPGWDGELLPLPKQVALRVGNLREKVHSLLLNRGSKEEVVEELSRVWQVEKFGREKVVEQISEHISLGCPLPSQNRIVIEGYDRFLIVHSCFGDRVNDTLGELFEEILMRKGIVRQWHADGYRILIELNINTMDIDFDDLKKELFGFNSTTVHGFLRGIIRKHFPFGYYMKFVAERFGALKRGLLMGGEAQKELGFKFRLTPIYDETLREAMMLHVDLETVEWMMDQVSSGTIKVEVFKSVERPSALAYPVLNKYVENMDFALPPSVERSNLDRMRNALENEMLSLLCVDCGSLAEYVKVKEVGERPECRSCRSRLLAVTFWSSKLAQQVVQKRLSHQKLDDEEQKMLTQTRRSADLVLSYGKKAIIAQCVYGIGPQTASKVLAKMHDEETEFYRDLMEAKMNFITTRPFWDKR